MDAKGIRDNAMGRALGAACVLLCWAHAGCGEETSDAVVSTDAGSERAAEEAKPMQDGGHDAPRDRSDAEVSDAGSAEDRDDEDGRDDAGEDEADAQDAAGEQADADVNDADSGAEDAGADDRGDGASETDGQPLTLRPGLWISELPADAEYIKSVYFVMHPDGSVSDFTYQMPTRNCNGTGWSTTIQYIRQQVEGDTLAFQRESRDSSLDVQCQFLEDEQAACQVSVTSTDGDCFPAVEWADVITGPVWWTAKGCDYAGEVSVTAGEPSAAGAIPLSFEVAPIPGCDQTPEGLTLDVEVWSFGGGGVVTPAAVAVEQGIGVAELTDAGDSVTLRIERPSPFGEASAIVEVSLP